MPTIEAQRIYPAALGMAKRSQASIAGYKTILKRAVDELGCVNLMRMKHVQAVAASLEAITRKDSLFFFDKIPAEIKEADMQRYQLSTADHQQTYQDKLGAIFEIYARLSPKEKEILELTVWAHDLGIPFGLEWEHHISGAKVARQIIKDAKLQEAVAGLVHHHGQFSNLASSSFPQDIYQLPRRWQSTLFVFDFCDATARIDQAGNHNNRIGLRNLEYYLGISEPKGLVDLEKAKNLFALRIRYGFGPIIFNRALSKEVELAMFEQAPLLIPGIKDQDLVDFYGGRFRCHFLDILLLASLKTPQERGLLLASIYQIYHKAQMTGKVLLWPDKDLGRILGKGLEGFVQKFKSYFAQNGIKGLLKASPSQGQIKFLVSLL